MWFARFNDAAVQCVEIFFYWLFENNKTSAIYGHYISEKASIINIGIYILNIIYDHYEPPSF